MLRVGHDEAVANRLDVIDPAAAPSGEICFTAGPNGEVNGFYGISVPHPRHWFKETTGNTGLPCQVGVSGVLPPVSPPDRYTSPS